MREEGFDLLGELERRGVSCLLDQILLLFQPRDVLNVFSVCRLWNGWDSESFWRRKLQLLTKENSWLHEKLEEYSDLTDKQKCLMIFKLNSSWDNAKADVQKVSTDSTVLCTLLTETSILVGLNNGVLQEIDLQANFIRDKEIHNRGVKVLRATASGMLLTGSYDGFLSFWDKEWFNIRRVELGVPLTDILVEQDRVYVSGDEGKIWCFKQTKSVHGEDTLVEAWHIQGGEMINCLAYFTQSNYLVTGCDNGDLNVRDGLTGQLSSTLAGHQAGCGITCLQQDGIYLWTASFDCTIRYWASQPEWNCLAVLTGHSPYPIRALAVTPAHIVSGDYRGFVMVWRKEEVNTVLNNFNKTRKPEKQHMQGDEIYRIRKGRLVQHRKDIAEVLQHSSFLEHSGHVTSLQVNSGLLVSGSRDRSVNIYKFWGRSSKKTKTRTCYYDNFSI